MEEPTPQTPKRPGAMTPFAIMIALTGGGSLVNWFTRPAGERFVENLVIGLFSLVAAVGLWQMKKWGAYLLGIAWGGSFLIIVYRFLTGAYETSFQNIALLLVGFPVVFLLSFIFGTMPILNPERYERIKREAEASKSK